MKTIFVLLFLTFTTLSAFCEKDTIIYYSKLGKVTDAKSNPQSYDQVKRMTDSVCYLEHYIKKADKWIHDGDDSKMTKKNDSTYVIYGKVTSKTDTIYRKVKKYKSGYIIKDIQDKILISTGFSRQIIPLIKEGKWTNFYFSTALIKSEEEYVNNQMTGNKRWKEAFVEDIADVFTRSEVDPEFIGGSKKLITFLSTNTKYPGKSDRQGEKGTVTVQFIVMDDGTIDGVEILKSVSPSLDAESIRVVKSMPQWTPGTTNGKNVRVFLLVPIQYSLPKI
jgi:protein TonB